MAETTGLDFAAAAELCRLNGHQDLATILGMLIGCAGVTIEDATKYMQKDDAPLGEYEDIPKGPRKIKLTAWWPNARIPREYIRDET
jgi:hypothetical protein